jgi:hypothetical protein
MIPSVMLVGIGFAIILCDSHRNDAIRQGAFQAKPE